jgi:UDP:flavonoid glycosyltransferase YjiC (YdhE family)
MRILFTSHPGFGHFHPLVPVARALAQAGHEVAFATAASFQQVIVDNGFRCFAAGTDWQTASEGGLLEAQKRHQAAAADPQAQLRMMAEMIVGRLGRRMLPDLIPVCREFAPDLVLRDSIEFAGCVAAEHLGIPHASVQVGAGRPSTLMSAELGGKIAELRALVGLGPDPQMLYRYLHLAFVPPSYQADGDLPPTVHFFRPALFDQSGSEGLPDWAAQLGRRPVVYATLGTVFNKVFHPFKTILEGLREEPIDLVVTVGRDIDPAQLGPQPAHIHVERYIPQTLIFPKCDAAILHGGFNSVLSALCHGLPLLVIPLAADQPMNAERCRQLGVGQVLPPGELTPDKVRDAVRALLKDPSYRHNAQRLQAEAEALPGLDQAVARIARLGETRQPQTR